MGEQTDRQKPDAISHLAKAGTEKFIELKHNHKPGVSFILHSEIP